MKPWDAYALYAAIKLHFESESYDAIKYNYKTSAKPQSFLKRRDKYHFAKLASKFNSRNEVVDFLVSHFISADSKRWIGEMLSDDDTYRRWRARIERISYEFANDMTYLEGIETSLRNWLVLQSGNTYPSLITYYHENRVSLETVTVLDVLTDFMSHSDKRVVDTILWPETRRLVYKYRPFLLRHVNMKKMASIVKNMFTSQREHDTMDTK